jgi:hypothetical protein
MFLWWFCRLSLPEFAMAEEDDGMPEKEMSLNVWHYIHVIACSAGREWRTLIIVRAIVIEKRKLFYKI